MKSLKYLLIFVSVLVFSGCAVNNIDSPSQSGANSSTSITGRWQKQELTLWEGHRLDAIDDKSVSFGLAMNPYTVTIPVEPGERKLVVLALFNNGRVQLSATIPMVVILKPATKYRINAAVKGSYIEAWLEIMGTSEIASEVFKDNCVRSAFDGVGFKRTSC
jgi:hypothetical protein